jgi:peroxiredoxin
LASAAVGAAAQAQVNVSMLGPQVGAEAIAFSLTDYEGRAHTLDTLAGPKGTMLLFFRSADW